MRPYFYKELEGSLAGKSIQIVKLPLHQRLLSFVNGRWSTLFPVYYRLHQEKGLNDWSALKATLILLWHASRYRVIVETNE